MANIINKSNHPVQIKKISVLMWTLRDELEAALAKRLAESTEDPPNIDDIKEFYGRPAAPRTLPADESTDGEETQGLSLVEDSLEEGAGNQDSFQEVATEVSEEDQATIEGLADGILPADSVQEASDGQTDANQSTATEDQKDIPKNRLRPSEDKIVKGFALMTDLTMESFLLFSRGSFFRGQSIVIELLIPNRFAISAEVIKCDHIARSSRIISEDKPNYRMQCLLTFNQPGERATLREFLKSIEPEIPIPPKKVKKLTDSEEDDEFEDLGF